MNATLNSASANAAQNSAQLFSALGLPATAVDVSNVRLYRLPQVLDRIPVSRSSWFAGIQSGRYPKGYSLGLRTTVWRSDEIEQLVTSLTH
jgi:prophage regulatory protein